RSRPAGMADGPTARVFGARALLIRSRPAGMADGPTARRFGARGAAGRCCAGCGRLASPTDLRRAGLGRARCWARRGPLAMPTGLRRAGLALVPRAQKQKKPLAAPGRLLGVGRSPRTPKSVVRFGDL